MARRCGFCKFETDDDAAFAEHLFAAHRWGAGPPRPAAQFCASCGAPRERAATNFCRSCGAPFAATVAAAGAPRATAAFAEGGEVARSYFFGVIAQLVASGALDEETAQRVRDAVHRHEAASASAAAARPERALEAEPAVRPPVAVPPMPRVDAAPAAEAAPAIRVDAGPPATAAAVTPAGPGLFSPERAPSLLLYVGAFLIVVSALIFVNVSGEQVSDAAKLALMLIGTLGFIGVGLLCYRLPRVREAGGTFLMIGALLVPLDFAAYYVLVARASPLTTPEMWILGSGVSAVLYAVLALAGYGRAYAFLFFAAALSLIGAVDTRFDLRDGWAAAAFVALAVALQAADDHLPALAPLIAPLRRVTRALAVVFAAVGIALSLAFPSSAAWGLTATTITAAVYYALRTPSAIQWELWLAALGPGAIAISIVHGLSGVAQTYGFVLALLAIAYGVAGDVARLGTPVRSPEWLRQRARALSWACVIGSLLPVNAYWRAPAVGALVNTAMAAFLLVSGVTASRKVVASRTRVDLGAHVLIGALALHLGALFAGISRGLVSAGVAPFGGLVERELAILFAPITAALAIAAFAARRRFAALEASLAVAALISATATVLLAFDDRPLGTLLATVAAAGAVAAAYRAGRARILWIAAVFLAVAAVALDGWARPAPEWRPLVIAAAAVALFIPPFVRSREHPFARVVREIAMAAAGAAVVIGLAQISGRVDRMTELPTWLATIPTFAVLGALGVAEALDRRSERGVVAATSCFLFATLMLIGRFRPDAVEAYGWPVALYLAAVAWGVARFGGARIRSSLVLPAQFGAAAVLMGSSLAVIPSQGDVPRIVLVLGEALAVLRWAAPRGVAPVAGVSLLVLAATIYRSIVVPLAYESATSVFGVVAIAMALAAPRWIPWRLSRSWLEAVEVVGVALVVAGALARTFEEGGPAAARALAESLALVAVGVAAARPALTLAALASVGLEALWILAVPRERELYGAAAGASLIALALAGARFRPAGIDARALVAMETGGAALLILPTLIAGWSDAFFPRTVVVFAEILAVLGIGVVLRRRWLVAGALAALGLETIRGLIDAVNRLPNWALFGASGALLLVIGFVLLLKRDAWNAWARSMLRWWAHL